MERVFTSIDKKHQITINIIENICYIEITLFQHQSFKTFLILFKEVMEYVNKLKVQYIKQIILNEELNMFNNIHDSIGIDNNKTLITFKLSEYPTIFYNALGLLK